MKLVKIDLTLDVGEGQEFSFQKASLMQGVLMEWLPADYAGKLHQNRWNPYSQHLERRDGVWHWLIHTFEEEADEKIGAAVLDPGREEIELKHGPTRIRILDRQVTAADTDQLLNQYYFQDAPRSIRVSFQTPTAFKRQGEYLNYPDMRCVYQSMILKYDAVTAGTGEVVEPVLEELTANTRVKQYRLRSGSFHMEGVRIPSFMGELLLTLGGSQTLTNYVHFLFHFACYSGIGIKTAMGMGSIDIQENNQWRQEKFS